MHVGFGEIFEVEGGVIDCSTAAYPEFYGDSRAAQHAEDVGTTEHATTDM